MYVCMYVYVYLNKDDCILSTCIFHVVFSYVVIYFLILEILFSSPLSIKNIHINLYICMWVRRIIKICTLIFSDI